MFLKIFFWLLAIWKHHLPWGQEFNLLLKYKHIFKIFKFSKRNKHTTRHSLTIHKGQQKWQNFKHLIFKFLYLPLQSFHMCFSNLVCDELYKPNWPAGTCNFAPTRSIAPKSCFTWWVFKPNTPARFQGLQIAQLIKGPSTNPWEIDEISYWHCQITNDMRFLENLPCMEPHICLS